MNEHSRGRTQARALHRLKARGRVLLKDWLVWQVLSGRDADFASGRSLTQRAAMLTRRTQESNVVPQIPFTVFRHRFVSVAPRRLSEFRRMSRLFSSRNSARTI